MSFATAVRTCFGKYVTLSGRATRSEFWWFALFFCVAFLGAGLVDGFVGAGGILLAVLFVGLLPPVYAVCVRRLHDTGRSGWYLLASLIPLVGWIFPLVYQFQDSEAGTNRYGPDPKAMSRTHPWPAVAYSA